MALETPTAISSGSFGDAFTVEPKVRHTYTAVLLHGRGSHGQEFAEELFTTQVSDGSTLLEKLPCWKWVFPSSKELWSTAFQEEMPAWFEAHSLTDVAGHQDLQMPSIRDSVSYLNDILNKEMAKLEGKKEKVIVFGISQGAAIGMWTLLCSKVQIGAFIGASAWLPFAEDLRCHFSQSSKNSTREKVEAAEFVRIMTEGGSRSWVDTPVFPGHGIDDAYVDVELGRQARDALTSLGMKVEWKEYQGAEQEGHWLKEPEEIDDIFQFLSKITK
ncbi:hypothetical protein S40288_06976 [Stachybotrys chartarum IBT 40288]|nr:hypothetical protein S40288_06976 [Stachybotrys chartarum IBT 40288]